MLGSDRGLAVVGTDGNGQLVVGVVLEVCGVEVGTIDDHAGKYDVISSIWLNAHLEPPYRVLGEVYINNVDIATIMYYFIDMDNIPAVPEVLDPVKELKPEAIGVLRRILHTSKDEKLVAQIAQNILAANKPTQLDMKPQIVIKDSQVQLLVQTMREVT